MNRYPSRWQIEVEMLEWSKRQSPVIESEVNPHRVFSREILGSRPKLTLFVVITACHRGTTQIHLVREPRSFRMVQSHNAGPDHTGREWVFDFFLSLLRSPQWDVAVMGFIEEHCAVFDTDEENKLAYTTLHQQFKDLVSLHCEH